MADSSTLQNTTATTKEIKKGNRKNVQFQHLAQTNELDSQWTAVTEGDES